MIGAKKTLRTIINYLPRFICSQSPWNMISTQKGLNFPYFASVKLVYWRIILNWYFFFFLESRLRHVGICLLMDYFLCIGETYFRDLKRLSNLIKKAGSGDQCGISGDDRPKKKFFIKPGKQWTSLSILFLWYCNTTNGCLQSEASSEPLWRLLKKGFSCPYTYKSLKKII